MKNNNDNMASNIAKKNNIDINELKRAAQSGNIEDFIDKKLPHDASKKVMSILSDKTATEKLMSTPQARELMKKLMNNK